MSDWPTVCAWYPGASYLAMASIGYIGFKLIEVKILDSPGSFCGFLIQVC